MKKYRTILFDLDDTLLDYTGDEKRSIRKTFEKNGIDFANDIFDLYYSIDDWQLFSMGNITAKAIITDHFRRMCKILEINADKIPELCDDFFDFMAKSHRFKYGARKVLEYLKSQNYRIYIISNGFSDFQRKRIKDSGMDKFLDGIFISEEMDVRKPNKFYFDYVINRIGECDRRNVLIVGDAPTADVLGGINSGIDVCWLKNGDRHCNRKHKFEIKNLNQLINIL